MDSKDSSHSNTLTYDTMLLVRVPRLGDWDGPWIIYERRRLSVAPPEQMSSSRPMSNAYSPPVVTVRGARTQMTPPRPKRRIEVQVEHRRRSRFSYQPLQQKRKRNKSLSLPLGPFSAPNTFTTKPKGTPLEKSHTPAFLSDRSHSHVLF